MLDKRLKVLNIAELAKVAGMSDSTFRSKLLRSSGMRFLSRDVAGLERCLAEIGKGQVILLKMLKNEDDPKWGKTLKTAVTGINNSMAALNEIIKDAKNNEAKTHKDKSF